MCALTRFDPEIFTPHFNRIGFDGHSLVRDQFSGRNVVLPTVPWAGYRNSLKKPLAERPASVEAGIVDGIELIADIGDRDCEAIHLELPN